MPIYILPENSRIRELMTFLFLAEYELTFTYSCQIKC